MYFFASFNFTLYMQGKLIAVAYTLRTYWNLFSLGGICKQEWEHQCSFGIPSRIKALNFDNFDNSHNSFLWPEYFFDFLCERWIPCLEFTLPPRDSTLQYKRCIHLWNNFPCIIKNKLIFLERNEYVLRVKYYIN